jgi:uncharacterized protein YjbJ (UPF0337 family)
VAGGTVAAREALEKTADEPREAADANAIVMPGLLPFVPCVALLTGTWVAPNQRCRGAVGAHERRRNSMNRDTLKGQWTQLKGKAREQWGKLTDDELDQMQGNAEILIGKIQERYGRSREEAEREFDRWYEQHNRAA